MKKKVYKNELIDKMHVQGPVVVKGEGLVKGW